MSIKFTCEINSMQDFPAWSGGKQNLDKVIESGRIDELDNLVEELFFDSVPTDGELNDFLWFELDNIDEFKHLWDTERWVIRSEEDGEEVYFVSADETPTEDADKAAHFDSEEAADEARINIADVKWPNGSWEVVSTFELDESVKEDVSNTPADDEVKQWRIPNPLGIDTIFVGTQKAAEEYGKRYGFTPEEVK